MVATDALLTKVEATKVARMAHDGLRAHDRALHTMMDGDIVFALATGAAGAPADVTALGAAAATVLARAVLAAVRAATSLAGMPATRDLALGGSAARPVRRAS